MAWLHYRHWPQHTPQPLHVEQVTKVYQVGEQRSWLRRSLRSNSLSLISKTCLSELRSSLNLYSSQGSNMLMSGVIAH